jgi:type II restriction enzyme
LKDMGSDMRMRLELDRTLAEQYTSPSQKARILTEGWVKKQAYCPNCGKMHLERYSNNQPVADFFCSGCNEDYELKSQKNAFGLKINDGAYKTMIERLAGTQNPNFFLLNYELKTYQVLNFLVIPKHFFRSDIIEKRKPLSENARRAGWTGCNILINRIPQIGRIFLVKDKQIESKNKVQEIWHKTLFLRQHKEEERGWYLDIMNCVDTLDKKEFTLSEIYTFEEKLQTKHPHNNHIKAKIRQQLQELRDHGLLEFSGKGIYKKLQ